MFKNILAAIDGSQPSLHALTVAADLAQQQDAALTIMTAVPPLPPLVMEDATQAYMPEYQERVRKSHEELLTSTTADLKKSHPGLKTVTVLKEGSPARKIIIWNPTPCQMDMAAMAGRAQRQQANAILNTDPVLLEAQGIDRHGYLRLRVLLNRQLQILPVNLAWQLFQRL